MPLLNFSPMLSRRSNCFFLLVLIYFLLVSGLPVEAQAPTKKKATAKEETKWLGLVANSFQSGYWNACSISGIRNVKLKKRYKLTGFSMNNVKRNGIENLNRCFLNCSLTAVAVRVLVGIQRGFTNPPRWLMRLQPGVCRRETLDPFSFRMAAFSR